MSDYLEVDLNGLAIGGVYQKHPNIDPSEWLNWVEISGDAQLGWTWDSQQETWVMPEPHLVTLQELRVERDLLIGATDFAMSRWADLVGDDSYTITEADTSTYREYLAYRRTLRDITEGYVPVEYPAWPVLPE